MREDARTADAPAAGEAASRAAGLNPGRFFERAGRVFAIGLGVAIPLSTAADNVLLALLLACFFLGSAYRERLSFIAARPALVVGPALFVLFCAGALFDLSRAREAFGVLGKYTDLALIPVMAVFFRDAAARRLALWSFSAAVVVSMAASYALFAGMPRYGLFVLDPLLAVPFKHSITHSLLVGFGAFVFVQQAAATASPTVRVAWFCLAALALTNVLVVIPGRTTHLVVVALVIYWAYTRWGWRGVSKTTLAAVVVVAVSYGASSLFRDRVNATAREYFSSSAAVPAAKTSSIGLRLEFYRNSLRILRGHPLTGVGTGGFEPAYAEQVRGTAMLPTANPHSEYLLIAIQVGAAGLVLLLYLFYVQWRDAPRLASQVETHLARGLVLTFAIGCLFNSFLLDHTEGLLFAWFTGLLYGGLQSSRQ